MAEHSSRAVRRAGRHRVGWSRRGARESCLATAVTVTAATVGAVGAAAAAVPTVADAAPTHASSTKTSTSSSTKTGTLGDSPAARAARTEPLVPGTPCSISAQACVDLDSQRAWLIDDGEVVRGPMRITSGAPGFETPIGHSFRVYRQEADHVSAESTTPDGRPAPMPFSTFFADGGVAFHGGSLSRASAGCVHLADADAEAVYDHLQNGDKVQVVSGSQERAARQALA